MGGGREKEILLLDYLSHKRLLTLWENVVLLNPVQFLKPIIILKFYWGEVSFSH